MKKLKIKDQIYYIIKNNKEYDLELLGTNILCLKRKKEEYIRLNLKNTCLGLLKIILSGAGIEIRKEAF